MHASGCLCCMVTSTKKHQCIVCIYVCNGAWHAACQPTCYGSMLSARTASTQKLISLSLIANMMADQPDRPRSTEMHALVVIGKIIDHIQLACLTICFEHALIPLSVYNGSCHFCPASSRAYAASRSPSVAEPHPLLKESGLVKIFLFRNT